jgi:hypothetical protein
VQFKEGHCSARSRLGADRSTISGSYRNSESGSERLSHGYYRGDYHQRIHPIRLKAPAHLRLSSGEKSILGQVTENAEHFEQELAAGFVPDDITKLSAVRDVHALPSIKLAEAQSTLEDLVANDAEDQEPKPRSGQT